MKLLTKIFDEVDISDDKIITFANGIIGFPDLQKFAIIHDEKRGAQSPIRWLQSIDEPAFALPIMDPLTILDNYNPQVEDELLKPVGDLDKDQMLVMVTVTVPSDITKMSVNLKAPIVINANERKACQVIAEGDEYAVKFPIYDIIQKTKKAGD
ncbi:MAG: flagellar assembly protein FliW [Lachnospiraceae bacterium]|nr:flagellar assembly protein FliW [Candidatus Merdinaster equi]